MLVQLKTEESYVPGKNMSTLKFYIIILLLQKILLFRAIQYYTRINI